MSRGSPIRDEAAMLLCPNSRADGISILDQLIAEMSKKISLLALCFKFVLLTLIFTACVAVVWLHLTDYTSKSQILPWTLCIVSVVGIAIQFTVWYKIQHSELGRKLATLRGDIVPENLKYLISAYAADVKRAETKIGTVPSSLFASHWAILLFSRNTEMRGWVRSRDGKRESKEIYAVSSGVSGEPVRIAETASTSVIEPPKAPISTGRRYYKDCDGSNERPNVNSNAEHQYLVSGSWASYVTCRDNAFSHLTTNKYVWSCFVLDGARFELRSGGQDGAIAEAIRGIRKELIRVFGHDRSPMGGDPQKSLENLLYSTARNSEIRKHFSS